MKDKENQEYKQVQARLLAQHLIESENRRKEKQIEEMAVLGCLKTPAGRKCAKCQFAHVDMCIPYKIATIYYEQDYRKIDKDSIVLTETERIAMCVEQWDKGYAQGSKETAEKCRNFVKEWVGNDEEGLGFLFDFEDFITKQLGVEIRD